MHGISNIANFSNHLPRGTQSDGDGETANRRPPWHVAELIPHEKAGLVIDDAPENLADAMV